VIRVGEAVFVDTGAWIALALTRDPLHPRAAAAWAELLSAGAKLQTSVPVVIETFTFLDRNTTRQVALTWKESLSTVRTLRLLPSTRRDLERAWKYFERTDLHKLSAVDAVSFVLMTDRRIRMAFAFDGHFAEAGFQMIG
jgi:predicted nucleic acid-binding protein